MCLVVSSRSRFCTTSAECENVTDFSAHVLGTLRLWFLCVIGCSMHFYAVVV